MDDLKQVTEQRFEVAREIHSLQELRKSEGGWTEETRERFDRMVEQHSSLGDRIQELEDQKRDAVELTSAEPEDTPFARSVMKKTGYQVTADTRNRAMRAWFMRGEASQEDISAAKAIGMNLEANQMRFNLNGRAPRNVQEADNAYQRAQATTPGTAGGYTVEPEMMRAIDVALLHWCQFRQFATVYRTSTGQDLPIPTVNDTASEQWGAILDENTQVGEDDVTFGEVRLKPFKYTSKLVRVSVELMQDNQVNLPALLGRLLGERIARIQDSHFTVGAGTTEPRGITLDAADSGVVLASQTAITSAELHAIKYAVDSAYAMNGAWGLTRARIGQIAGMTTENGGNSPVWAPSFAADVPSTILGDPYYEMPNLPTGLNAKNIVYGDLSKYHIADATEIVLLRLNERYADFYQVGFMAHQRSDGALVDAGTGPVVYAANPAA